MKIQKSTAPFLAITLLLHVVCFLNLARASQEDLNFMYFGSGRQISTDPYLSTSKAHSFGIMNASSRRNNILGFDIAREGLKLNETWGTTSTDRALSFNFIIGTNLARSGAFRLDGGLLLGFRHGTTSCPRSYIGYQCYANQAPTTTYEANYGGLLAITYSSITLGLRLTGESKQGFVGIAF